MREFWTISFGERSGKWIATNDAGRIMDGATPGELLEKLPRTAGQDKMAKFVITITGKEA